MTVQWARHTLRLLIVALVAGLPLLAAQRVAHPAPGARSSVGEQVAGFVRGNTWSLEIGPLSLTDPLAGLESLAAGKALVPAILIGLAIPVLFTVVVGRVFCTWICPVGFLLEFADRMRGALEKLKVRSRNIPFWRGNKYILLGLGLGLSALWAFPLLGSFYPPAVLVGEVHQWVYGFFVGSGGGLTWGALLIGGILVAELFVSRRMWCRYFCPGGALYNILGWRRLVRVSPPDATCDNCGDCVTECGMGLNPMLGMTGVECDNCLVCVSTCHLDALHSKISPRTG